MIFSWKCYVWIQGLGWTMKTRVDETPFLVFNVRVDVYAHNQRVIHICVVLSMCGC
jgi:hypothetical protein